MNSIPEEKETRMARGKTRFLNNRKVYNLKRRDLITTMIDIERGVIFFVTRIVKVIAIKVRISQNIFRFTKSVFLEL